MTVTMLPRSDFNVAIRTRWAEIQAGSNAEIKSAGKAQRRELIAKDAMEWVGRGLIEPYSGTYFSMSAIDCQLPNDYENPGQLHDQILERAAEGDPCESCALGSMLVAFCLRFNNIEIGEELDYDLVLTRYDMFVLGEIFDADQLALIETAFETLDRVSHFGNLTYRQHLSAANFGNQYESDRERFFAIMRNIVKNNGTFKP